MPIDDTRPLPDAGAVRDAAARLAGVALRTPVLTSRTLDELAGARIHLKCESFQRSGAFKFRGAYNALARLTAEERAGGVVTHSSGNHAQAIALAGSILGIRTAVVMPRDAPAAKLAATRGYGAEVILYDPAAEIREEVSGRLRTERGATLIPPYDHPDVVAGQGTAALELLQEVGGLDAVVTPCGGGGLLSGTALIVADERPGAKLFGVEPELADDAARTMRTGELQRTSNPPTIADGLRTPSLGRIPHAIIRERVEGIWTVSESEIVEAMRFLWSRMKIVVEPSGATALAPLLRGVEPSLAGKRIGVVVSGGNVDLGAAMRLMD